jgi:hypothetical protein
MNAREKIVILVAEPWDFTSTEGNNIFSGTIIDNLNFNHDEVSLVKVNQPFTIDEIIINYVVITNRHKPHVNIGYIPDNYVHLFKQFDSIKERIKFIMIGSLKSKTNN